MRAFASRGLILLLSAGVWLASGAARANTLVNRQGPGGVGSGNWSSAADWSGGVVPYNGGGNFFSVILPTQFSPYTVTRDINVGVDNLTLDSGATMQTRAVTRGGSSLTLDTGMINSAWNGGTGNWSTATDWTPNGAPNNGGGNVFNVTIDSGGSDLVSLDINATIASLVLGGTTGGSQLINLANTAETLEVTGATTINQTGNLTFSNASTLKLDGGLTIAAGGQLNLNGATSGTITGNVTNSGEFNTGFSGGGNVVTVTGAFTNNTGALLQVDGSGDIVNLGTLSNSGTVTIAPGATLNLTGQPNGITDVPQGSTLIVEGTLNAGAANGLAKLTTIEGGLDLENGATTSITPTGGTLTASSTSSWGLSGSAASTTTLSINGNVNNSGQFTTGFAGGKNTVTVTGAFTNNAGGLLDLESSGDVANLGSLSNSGTVTLAAGTTLNLTNEPNGITDVPQGSELTIAGTLNAGSANGLAKLTSVEGQLNLENSATTTVVPTGGTLTISSTGFVQVPSGATTLTVTGNVNNSGQLTTGFNGGNNTVNVSGAFTNNTNATVDLEGSGDILNVGTLTNSGTIAIGIGATLNLTSQPNGITDVVAGSTLNLAGTLNAGSANGLAKLSSVEGTLRLENAATTAVVPTGGTLTISSVGELIVDFGSTATITGNVNNSGQFDTGFNSGPNTVSVSGAFTNNAGASLVIAGGASTNDVVSVGTLTNSGTVNVGNFDGAATGATLNLTASGTDTNSGTINIGSTGPGTGTLKISGSAVTLSGAGKIILSNLAGNLITGAAPTDILTSANTIEGSGNIGNGSLGFVNTGTVLANQSTALIIDPSSSGFNNKGTVNVSAGDTLEITGPANSFLNYNSTTNTLTGGTYLVSGTLQFGAPGNTITTDAAKITLTGANAKIVDPSNGNILAPLSSISKGGVFDITSGANFTTQGNFTNNGTLTVGGGSKFVVKTGSSLTNFSGTTLAGGIYNVTGTLQFGSSGTSLVTNAASITLTGTHAKIIDSANQNILTAFATNNAGASFDVTGGASFTTAGNFTNNGSLIIGSSSSKFDVNGNLTNFNSTTNTLSSGIYNVAGTLQFNSANIVVNAANLTLTGTAYKILNQSAGNALANFTTNSSTGKLTLAKNANLTTGTGFSNAGTVTVQKGSNLTVGGSGAYTQSGGTTTVDGTLTASGGEAFNGGSVFGNGGNLNGNVTNGATFNIGDKTKQAGTLSVSGSYTQNSTGALDIDIGGTTAGTQYDQFVISSTATLGGTLNLDLINGFMPTLTDTFDILNAASVVGTFATVNTPTFNGGADEFGVVYNATNVMLDVIPVPGFHGGLLAENLPPSSPTPEPGSLLLLGTGLSGLAGYLKRRRARR